MISGEDINLTSYLIQELDRIFCQMIISPRRVFHEVIFLGEMEASRLFLPRI